MTLNSDLSCQSYALPFYRVPPPQVAHDAFVVDEEDIKRRLLEVFLDQGQLTAGRRGDLLAPVWACSPEVLSRALGDVGRSIVDEPFNGSLLVEQALRNKVLSYFIKFIPKESTRVSFGVPCFSEDPTRRTFKLHAATTDAEGRVSEGQSFGRSPSSAACGHHSSLQTLEPTSSSATSFFAPPFQRYP